jgi:hypothetical protein
VVCQTFDKGTADEIVFAANNGDFIHPHLRKFSDGR